METILEIKNLTKKFGRITAVESLNLTIKPGQVFGILGPNGSGKTTTLGMILDVVSPTEGGFQWFGDKSPEESRRMIGSILETPCFYPYLTAVQNLRIAAHIKRCSSDRIDKVLQKVNLFERKDDNFKTFSLGMKQRLSIAAALLADPPVLILDEPTNGLDPQGIAEVRDLITSIADEGKTIIMASHLLDEVQKVCTHFCVLRKGIKLHEGAVTDILGYTNQVEVAADQPLDKSLEAFEGSASFTPTNGKEYKVILQEGVTPADVNQYFFDQGISLNKINPVKNSLEKEFLKILKEK